MALTVLSGIRATGRLHPGNYFGAMRHFVEFQNSENRLMFFVADWHTLTTLDDPEELRKNIPEIVKDYLAAGLDPERSILYTQSSVPQIAELCLLLSMLQPLGHLQRVPTFKDMVRKHPDRVTLGLISYPVLMAADILGPQADLVPVGQDQVPNVELARDLADQFNRRFGETFTLPKMLPQMIRVPGTDGKKMGKSDGNGFDLNATPDEIREAYRRAPTDPGRVRRDDPGTPKNCLTIYPMHELVTPGETTHRTIANRCRSADISCVDCKSLMAENLSKNLKPFQERRREFADKDELVRDVLAEGGRKAREIFQQTVDTVRVKMGLERY
ncbi:MAG TPA: tryptophan--tRNA ligase [Candidatus Paceibacterota bacterium]|nr:tryptophan--tRNA ligase [Candidatus Paceibacterota bacterium]